MGVAGGGRKEEETAAASVRARARKAKTSATIDPTLTPRNHLFVTRALLDCCYSSYCLRSARLRHSRFSPVAARAALKRLQPRRARRTQVPPLSLHRSLNSTGAVQAGSTLGDTHHSRLQPHCACLSPRHSPSVHSRGSQRSAAPQPATCLERRHTCERRAAYESCVIVVGSAWRATSREKPQSRLRGAVAVRCRCC